MANTTLQTASTLHELYPELDDEQRRQAAANLDHYLRLAIRILARVEANASGEELGP